MLGLTSLVLCFDLEVGLLSEGGGDDGVGSPPAALIEIDIGATSSAIENNASVISLIVNLFMRLS